MAMFGKVPSFRETQTKIYSHLRKQKLEHKRKLSLNEEPLRWDPDGPSFINVHRLDQEEGDYNQSGGPESP